MFLICLKLLFKNLFQKQISEIYVSFEVYFRITEKERRIKRPSLFLLTKNDKQKVSVNRYLDFELFVKKFCVSITKYYSNEWHKLRWNWLRRLLR